jgi:hypothetical protein|tara:strand:- start:3869 stop:4378 length:510 start_codon:yes stop_codon:yes gene_type:complete
MGKMRENGNWTAEHMRKNVNSKVTGPKTDMGKVKNNIANTTKGTARESLLDDAMLDAGFNPVDKRANIIKVMFTSWMNSKTTKKAKEIYNMERIMDMIELNMEPHLIKKLKDKKQFDPEDMNKLKLIIDTNEKLHKMKHGEKKQVVTASVKDIMHLFNKKMEEEPNARS